MSKAVVGIDVSKRKLDVALLFGGKVKHKAAPNTPDGFEELCSWLARNNAQGAHVCMEATSTYGEPVAAYLHERGFTVSMVNPSRIKGFAQSELSRTKTDKSDAALIARFCEALGPSAWTPDPPEVRELRALVRRLDALIGMRGQEANRLEGAEEVVAGRIREHLEYLDGEIKRIRETINERIDQTPSLREKRKLLESIPGIGPASVGLILAEFGDVTRFESAKHLAAFVGISPRRFESGSSVKGRTRMSKIGNARIRKALFMPALVALRHNEAFIAFRQRLLDAGKAKMLIVGAAMRKLVHVIYGVLKSGRPFNAKLAMGT